MLVNATIVHHNHGAWHEKWLHLVQCTLNESVEGFGLKSTLKDVAVQYTLSKREGRENRESMWGEMYVLRVGGRLYSPGSATEEGFPGCHFTLDFPGTPVISCSTVNCIFVNKDKLLCTISTNLSSKISTLFRTVLNSLPSQLRHAFSNDLHKRGQCRPSSWYNPPA